MLNKTAWGRHVYAIGDDKDAAELSGIRTDRMLVSIYAVAGFVVAIGAWVSIGRVGSVSPTSFYEGNLDSITELINDSYDEGVSKIIVVTGKGLHSNVEKDPYKSKDLSILKYSVPEFVKCNTTLMSIIKRIEDQTDNKNSGFFCIYLKLKNKLW